MNNEVLKEAFNLINILSKSLDINIISSSNLADIKENIENLDLDISNLQNKILKLKSTPDASQEKLLTLLTTLNISLVDILQDIENIHDILINIGKDYANYLEK